MSRVGNRDDEGDDDDELNSIRESKAVNQHQVFQDRELLQPATDRENNVVFISQKACM